MKKTIGLTLLLVCLVVLAVFFSNRAEAPTDAGSQNGAATSTPVQGGVKALSFMFNGEPVTFSDGVLVRKDDVGATTSILRYFGNELTHDVDGDGASDVVFFFTEETGGSGTFFYVVAALQSGDGYVGSEARFIGDRIAPQGITSSEGRHVVVSYAERAPEEPMAAAPTVGKSVSLLLNPETLQFAEASSTVSTEPKKVPTIQSLTGTTWHWVKTIDSKGGVVPVASDRFTLTFEPAETVSVGTDCNGAGASYAVTDGQLTFSDMMSTMMYCEGSRESEFTAALIDVRAFNFSTENELVLELANEKGSLVFEGRN